MTGGLMQLVACGAQDIFLTGSPMISYFKTVYRRHTNFATETIKQKFDTVAGFGTKVTCTLSRNGDLVTGAYIQATLPDLTEKTTANFQLTNNGLNAPTRRYVRWVDNIGHYLLKSVEVSIGGVTIDRHYSDWLEIWAQLTIPAGKMVGYRMMIGQDPKNIFGQNTGLQADVLSSVRSDTDVTYGVQNAFIVGRDIFIPLQFWFCRNVGLALPLIALQYHDVRIHIEFRSAEDLILVWAGDKAQPTGQPNGWIVAEEYASYVSHSSLSVSLWVDYVFLDADERRRFAQVSHEYLLEQVQYIEQELPSETRSTVDLAFVHPIKELLWTVKGFESSKEWSNFTNTQLPAIPPFQTASVTQEEMFTGLTGLPDETYIAATKLTLSLWTNPVPAPFVTGNISVTTAGVRNFVVIPFIEDGYYMQNGDVITVNDGGESDNVTLLVSRSFNGVATEFLTKDVLAKDTNYNNVISIVRTASVLTTNRLHINIRTINAIQAYSTVNNASVAGGVFTVKPEDDYSMLIGDIIKLTPNGDESKLIVLTVTAAVGGIATEFITRNNIEANITYNTVISIIRPASAAIIPSQLDVFIKFNQGGVVQNTIINVDNVETFTIVPDITYQMQVGDIITVYNNNTPQTKYSLKVLTVNANKATSLLTLNDMTAVTNRIVNSVAAIERPSNETGGLSQLLTATSGLSNIKTYDELMRFCNYNCARPYSQINGLAGCPVDSAVLILNNEERFLERPGSYFTHVQAYNHHTNIPETPGIMIYSFSLKPEEHQPSGTCNFSRLDNAKLRVKIGALYREDTKFDVGTLVKLSVYAVNYNILRIVNGMGGLAYNG